MSWTAIIPFNFGRACKTRLADELDEAERAALALKMAEHGVAQLRAVPQIGRVVMVAPEQPPLDIDHWQQDEGRGLNAELAAARAAHAPGEVLIIHADLPFLQGGDIAALLDAAHTSGAAMAPDRAGTGTNAIALADGRAFVPAFGVDSQARHRAALPDAAIVERTGLGFDIDQPECLDLARQMGMEY